MNKKKKSKTHYQIGEHEVVEELTLNRKEQRVEDATRKETECRRKYPRCAKERRGRGERHEGGKMKRSPNFLIQ